MKNLVIYLFLTISLLSVSCDDSTKKIVPPVSTACVVISETTSLTGNQARWDYDYDGSGNMKAVTRYNQVGNVSNNTVVSAKQSVNTSVVSGSADPVIAEYDYDQSVFDGQPTTMQYSITLDGVKQTNYKTYTFSYDLKGRISRVSESTGAIVGDLEYDAVLTYNDNDNVTKLVYEITAGPSAGTVGNTIIVKAYDEKPTPYSGTKGWKYLLNNFQWDNYDPEPVLTALSKNNPLDYTIGAGTPSEFVRTMTYDYNDNGFPTIRHNVNANAGGQYSFLQTFSYNCK